MCLGYRESLFEVHEESEALFAESTDVPASKSVGEILTLLAHVGGTETVIYKIKIQGETREVWSGTPDEEKMFDAIQQATRLDRAIATAILHGGNAIKHPQFTITLQGNPGSAKP